MSFDLIKVFHDMGLVAWVVVGALGLMAIVSMTVFIERLWAFRAMRLRSTRFAHVAGPLLQSGAYGEVVKEATTTFRAVPFAEVVSAGLSTWLSAPSRSRVPPAELVRREVERRLEPAGASIRRGLSALASVGSVAPFVGLLGTVIGIIEAFQGIAKEESAGIGAVSAGISEALVVTALGLFVAIPAVLAYNLLSGRADSLTTALHQSAGEFVDFVESQAERPEPAKARVHATVTAETHAVIRPERADVAIA